MLEFTIHPSEPPWSTNEDRNLHHMARAKRVKAWKEDAALGWITIPPDERAPYVGTPSIVQLEIGFEQKRTRDPHNYCGTVLKAVIDGLVAKGVWPDDTPEWVGHRESILVKGLLTRATLRAM
jgi:hypothetical protein